MSAEGVVRFGGEVQAVGPRRVIVCSAFRVQPVHSEPAPSHFDTLTPLLPPDRQRTHQIDDEHHGYDSQYRYNAC